MHVIVAANDALVPLIIYFDSFTTVVFRRVAVNAGSRQHVRHIRGLSLKAGNPDADCDLQGPVSLQISKLFSFLAYGRSHIERLIDRTVCQQNGEIIAREAGCHGILGQYVLEHLRKANNDFVTGFPSKCVIDELKVVQVQINNLMFVTTVLE